MGATIKDVAKEAGVSTATVSRVLNGSGPVSTATRARIHDVAERLRYAPNSSARSLITARTHTFGVLLPDLYGDFFSEVIRGIDQAAQKSDYHVLLSSSHTNRSGIEAAMRAMRGRVDGLIVMYPEIDGTVLRSNLPESMPVVLLNCLVSDGAFDAINIDNFGGAYAMVRHLVGHGHRRIAIIKGEAKNHDAAERLRGYRAALQDSGIEQDDLLEVGGAFTEATGYAATERLLESGSGATAIFAANDSMAIGAVSAVRRSGRRVPADMAVAGFDDIPIARYLNPRLSSVHVPISELGTRAMDRLMEAVRFENGHVRRQEYLPTRLKLRRSCGCGDLEHEPVHATNT